MRETEGNERWRTIAQQVCEETDPDRMLELCQELAGLLDQYLAERLQTKSLCARHRKNARDFFMRPPLRVLL